MRRFRSPHHSFCQTRIWTSSALRRKLPTQSCVGLGVISANRAARRGRRYGCKLFFHRADEKAVRYRATKCFWEAITTSRHAEETIALSSDPLDITHPYCPFVDSNSADSRSSILTPPRSARLALVHALIAILPAYALYEGKDVIDRSHVTKFISSTRTRNARALRVP
jgi:hypothetical protein